MSNPLRTGGARPRILLVEDDAPLRRALTFSLGIEGYDVQAMDCAQALLDHDDDEDRTILVLDQHLPDLTGLECLARLRRRGASTPAILLVAAPSRHVADQAAELDATVILKPILGDALVRAVARVAGAEGA